MESEMAATVLYMSTSPTTVLLPRPPISLAKEESPSGSVSVDSESLLAAASEERKDPLSTRGPGLLCRRSGLSARELGRNLLGELAAGMAMLRGSALLGLTAASSPPCRSARGPLAGSWVEELPAEELPCISSA